MKPNNEQEAYEEIDKLGQHVGRLYDKVGVLEKTGAADLEERLKKAEEAIATLTKYSRVPRSR